MLENCNYNKIRLLHDLSRVAWYLDKHAKKDAKSSGHAKCHTMCIALEKDLGKHMESIRKAIVGLSKKENFN